MEVGSDLYELDTEAEATVDPSSGGGAPAPAPAASDTEPPASAPAPVPAQAASPPPAPSKPSTQQHRTPSIHFLGKEGWERKLVGVPESPPVPPDYGRPTFTEEEMEALLTGGANLVPNVKQHSAGAVFGY